ncbi:MAG: hypothetical protein KAW17_05840 [Candidatus Eisenbacteria sp.]|nr:hypothetical protein [Candidatus Eisenbacteria bacterium]
MRFNGFLFFIAAAAAAVVSQPLLINWHVWGHSSTIDYARLMELDHLIREGYHYPRWAADFYYGFGSPIFNFYAPAGYWIAEIFALSGVSLLYSLKLTYVLSILLAGTGMFLFVRKMWGPLAGTGAATLYVFSPYFLLDVFVRASIGEVLCFAWIPWALFFLLRTLGGSRGSIPLAALFAALVICSHNITAMLFFPSMILLVFLHWQREGKWRVLLWGLVACALALGLSAFFWLPALAEKQFVQGNETLTTGDFYFGDHFIRARQLFERRWGFGTSAPGDSVSLQLGILHWILTAGAALVFLLRRRPWNANAVWLWTIFGGALFMALDPSRFIWERVALLHFVQFPWRFLLFATICSSALSGVVFSLLRGKRRHWQLAGAGALIIIVLLTYGGYTRSRLLVIDITTREPRAIEQNERAAARKDPNLLIFEDFFTVDVLRHIGMRATILDDFMPVWVPFNPKTLPEIPYRVSEGEVAVEPVREAPAERVYQVHSGAGGTIQFFTFWFPGWVGYLDGREIDLFPEHPHGCLSAAIPPGEHDLVIKFVNTPVRTAGELVSLASLVCAVAVALAVLVRRVRTPKA